ncbi:MAG: UvrD-helicase domain-containing protein, partial [Angelakisella sp.]
MAEVNWTPAQKNAIEGSGGNLLVSAAAGSGKTAVLAQRVLRLITDKDHPVDADRLLVATFSNAAAGEMKQRIARKLWELAEQNPGDRRLMRQQLLLDSAQISTIHSFCIRLLRTNFHLLGLPADFRVGDERETELLSLETARAVVADCYDKGDSVFLDLVELVSSARSDRKLEQTMLQLYKFLRNHPFYEEWMERVLAEYRQGQTLEESPWFVIIMDYARDAVDHCCGVLASCLAVMEQDEQLFAAYGGAFTSDLAQLERCRAVFAGNVWEDCRTV